MLADRLLCEVGGGGISCKSMCLYHYRKLCHNSRVESSFDQSGCVWRALFISSKINFQQDSHVNIKFYHLTSQAQGTGALVIVSLLDFLTYALCAPYSETTDGNYFDQLLELVASQGRILYKLFQVKRRWFLIFYVFFHLIQYSKSIPLLSE